MARNARQLVGEAAFLVAATVVCAALIALLSSLPQNNGYILVPIQLQYFLLISTVALRVLAVLISAAWCTVLTGLLRATRTGSIPGGPGFSGLLSAISTRSLTGAILRLGDRTKLAVAVTVALSSAYLFSGADVVLHAASSVGNTMIPVTSAIAIKPNNYNVVLDYAACDGAGAHTCTVSSAASSTVSSTGSTSALRNPSLFQRLMDDTDSVARITSSDIGYSLTTRTPSDAYSIKQAGLSAVFECTARSAACNLTNSGASLTSYTCPSFLGSFAGNAQQWGKASIQVAGLNGTTTPVSDDGLYIVHLGMSFSGGGLSSQDKQYVRTPGGDDAILLVCFGRLLTREFSLGYADGVNSTLSAANVSMAHAGLYALSKTQDRVYQDLFKIGLQGDSLTLSEVAAQELSRATLAGLAGGSRVDAESAPGYRVGETRNGTQVAVWAIILALVAIILASFPVVFGILSRLIHQGGHMVIDETVGRQALSCALLGEFLTNITGYLYDIVSDHSPLAQWKMERAEERCALIDAAGASLGIKGGSFGIVFDTAKSEHDQPWQPNLG